MRLSLVAHYIGQNDLQTLVRKYENNALLHYKNPMKDKNLLKIRQKYFKNPLLL